MSEGYVEDVSSGTEVWVQSSALINMTGLERGALVISHATQIWLLLIHLFVQEEYY